MDPVIAEQLGRSHPLARHLDDFLTDLANAGKSAHTRRAYRGDLIAFAAHHGEEIGELTAAPVRAYLAELADLSSASRKRKRAAIASFAKWAVRHDLLAANPMDRIDTVKVPKNLPRPASATDVAKVMAVICSRRPRKDLSLDRLRDRVLFETAYVCGARAFEVCGLYVEDLDLRLDDEHVRIHGKGGSVRTVLLDDRGYVTLLKLYLARAGYTAGPLFRAGINGRGGPLSYDAAHHRRRNYCTAARVEIDIHQLRHAHATELINAGVSIEAVRRRLGHPALRTAGRQGRRRRDPRRPPTPRPNDPLTTNRSGPSHPLASSAQVRDGFDESSAIFTDAVRWVRERDVLLPGVTTLARVRDETTRRLWGVLEGLLTVGQRYVLDQLLEVPPGSRISDLERWRKGPVPRGSGPTLIKALDQVAEVMGLGMGELGADRLVPPRRLAELAKYGMSADASQIRRHRDGRRLATLLATVAFLEAKSIDDTLELLDLLMTTELLNKAQTAADKEKIRKHPKLAKASARLAVAVEALFDSDSWGGPEEEPRVAEVWEAIEAVVSRAELRAALVLVSENVLPADAEDPEDWRSELVG
ncbi:tyrosine-type recombinase/integrase [Nonomuraea mangrovi]|uniref:Tyrosine-type recombinase/integrase n=1 Tax=Nonomuraea mangrovi TaxID=2316207 RepID=A0ABW4TEB9_9ACTN